MKSHTPRGTSGCPSFSRGGRWLIPYSPFVTTPCSGEISSILLPFELPLDDIRTYIICTQRVVLAFSGC